MQKRIENMVVGLAETGYSVARHLDALGLAYAVADDNANPARWTDLKKASPGVALYPINSEQLQQAKRLIVSPGVPLTHPALQKAKANGAELCNDVSIFSGLAKAPIVAITGSNGKTTVTSMLAHIAGTQKYGVKIAGNIGTPCLDVLDDEAQLYVLEVSSYQLELAVNMAATVAVVLNLSPDHLDRYANLDSYYAAKSQVYNNCEIAVVNRAIETDFSLTASRKISFGHDTPASDDQFGLIESKGETILMQGQHELLLASELKVRGGHNIQNVLATLALGSALALDMETMVADIKQFEGLAHRCEWLGDINGVTFINDSKATNTGATLSAIQGFAGDGNLILILGGQGKGANFAELLPVITRHIKYLLVYGENRLELKQIFADHVEVTVLDDLSEVLDAAMVAAVPGDTVLFSPACASFDMFENYQARGNEFKRLFLEKVQ